MASLIVTGCLLWALGTDPGISAGDASIDVRPLPGVLLLHSGQVLEGTVSRTGDRYHVVVDDGEIRVRADQVRQFCRDLTEAYRVERALVRPADTRARVALVQWCLRQRLLDEAEVEIRALAAAGLDARTLDAFRRQIEVLRSPRAAPEAQTAPRPFVPVSAQELSATLGSLPPRAVEQFVTSVEPLLLNSCLVGGCHGPRADNGFRLHRTPSGRGHSRRLTQRNLHAIMQMVDRQQPADSPLLKKLAAPHGQVREAPLDAEQLRLLAIWVQSVATTDARVPSTVSRVGATHPPRSAPNSQAAPAAGTPSANDADTGNAPGTTVGDPDDIAHQTPAATRQSQGTAGDEPENADNSAAPAAEAAPTAAADSDDPQPDTYTPVDPFDPEIFNRGLAPH